MAAIGAFINVDADVAIALKAISAMTLERSSNIFTGCVVAAGISTISALVEI